MECFKILRHFAVDNRLVSTLFLLTACSLFAIILLLYLPEANASEIAQCKLDLGQSSLDLNQTSVATNSGFEFLDDLIEKIIMLAKKLVKMVVQVVCAIINELGVNCTP